MKQRIAIIGLSFQVPRISNWTELLSSLGNHETHISSLPSVRKEDIFDRFGPMEMAKGGFLERVDLFDNEFFDLKEREALRMYPEHRLFLIHALKAFYDSGYTRANLKGTNTGVFYTASDSMYPAFFDGKGDWLDSLPGLEGTRLANFLDLRGPAISINTTCSSSLVAAHYACSSLQQGECNQALVGGVKLAALTKELADANVVLSKSESCKPFDKQADGMMPGEGVICMVLKRLEDARRDNDPIYAVIDGSAINHGGARISSLTAPSSEAQKEVLLKAWENADIHPSQLKFIEAHGTGTILGDPIEFTGVTQAFKEKGVTSETCYISSFKGQIGHLDNMSGLSGLLRLVASLSGEMIPMQPNFETINDHIDENDSAIRVSRTSVHWPAQDGRRTGGVSSYGLTGTNVHMVVSREDSPKVNQQGEEPGFIQFNQNSRARLDQRIEHVLNYILVNPSVSLKQISQKVNRLFEPSRYQKGYVFENRSDLIAQFKGENIQHSHTEAYFLLDLGLMQYGPSRVAEVLEENILIQECWEKLIGSEVTPKSIESVEALNVLFQFTIYKYLQTILGQKMNVVTKRGGGVLHRLMEGVITPEDILTTPGIIQENTNAFDYQKFRQYLSEKFAGKKIVVISFHGQESIDILTEEVEIIFLNGQFTNLSRHKLYTILLEVGEAPLKTRNVPIIMPGLEYPGFQFKRFWPKHIRPEQESGLQIKQSDDPASTSAHSLDSIKSTVSKIWKEVLETDEAIPQDADFFDLGGTRLTGLDMLDSLEVAFGGAYITYEEMYSVSTIDKISRELLAKLSPEIHDKNDLTVTDHTIESIKERVQSIWQEVLETNEKIGLEADFFDLGGTSLTSLDMLDSLEEAFGKAHITYEEMYSVSTIDKISATIFERIYLKNGDITIKEENKDNISPEERRATYDKLVVTIDQTAQPKKLQPGNIVITGGNGFLGSFLVNNLLQNTSADIVCLVRGKDNEDAEERFWWEYKRAFGEERPDRISVVRADIMKEGLDLPHGHIPQVDMVFHAAGSPAYVGNPNLEKHVNYLGTKNLFDWAQNQQVPHFNYISTIGLTGKSVPTEFKYFFETDVNVGQDTFGYLHSATKLKAEEYIRKHKNRTILKVFRIPNLGGRFSDGYFPSDMSRNLMYLNLKSIFNIGAYSDQLLDYPLNLKLAPVDKVAELVNRLALIDDTTLNTYHINLEEGFKVREVLEAFATNKIPMEKLNEDQFLEYLARVGSEQSNYYISMNKHGTLNKTNTPNTYKIAFEATHAMQSKADISINYNRLDYLSNIVAFALKNGFVASDSSKINMSV